MEQIAKIGVNGIMLSFVEEIMQQMAFPCNKDDQAGILIAINGKDHGVLGNKGAPAHAHLLDLSCKELGEFVITPIPPQKPADIQWHRTDNVPEGYGKKIVKWANGKKKKTNINCWDFLIQSWNTRHP